MIETNIIYVIKELFSSKATNFELCEWRRLSEEQNPIRKEFVVIYSILIVSTYLSSIRS